MFQSLKTASQSRPTISENHQPCSKVLVLTFMINMLNITTHLVLDLVWGEIRCKFFCNKSYSDPWSWFLLEFGLPRTFGVSFCSERSAMQSASSRPFVLPWMANNKGFSMVFRTCFSLIKSLRIVVIYQNWSLARQETYVYIFTLETFDLVMRYDFKVWFWVCFSKPTRLAMLGQNEERCLCADVSILRWDPTRPQGVGIQMCSEMASTAGRCHTCEVSAGSFGWISLGCRSSCVTHSGNKHF